jgi:hypothetical protein
MLVASASSIKQQRSVESDNDFNAHSFCCIQRGSDRKEWYKHIKEGSSGVVELDRNILLLFVVCLLLYPS